MTDTPTEITTPPGEPVIHIRRFFKAPPELVFRAITEPAYLRRWFGPRHLEITECEADLRVGGTWRVVHRAPDGMEFVFHGEFLELDPPRTRVGTFVWDGAPDAVATETMVCEPVEGGTMVVTTMVHRTVEARDMHVANGMEGGILDSHSRLDELLAAEQAT
ncbi:MAG TPA: SRPBCC family protein [Acidimicrobiales bacterium]|jgi:uncharacterized protein YndB with AHSA1/START domain